MEEKKKLGRPRTEDITKKKNYPVFINLTKAQKDKIHAKADKAGISLSQICVEALKAQNII